MGMPQAVRGHAVPHQTMDMEVGPGEGKPQDAKPTVQHTSDLTIVSKEAGKQRHRDKQNLDYVLKTGLAGGLAGCAVCSATPIFSPFPCS